MQLIFGTLMVGTNKSLGQHWLKNREILDEIALMAGEGELCIEIGPGLGFLTSSLLRRFGKVIAVEYDKNLAKNLPNSFPGKNLEVVEGDILKYDFGKIVGPYVVVGNIPYYITSPIIMKVLTTPNLPRRVVLLMQKEVVERIVGKKETVLSLFVKNRARVSVGPVVRAKEFTPPPKVDSEVIVIEPHTPEVKEEVFDLIHQGFVMPRKKLVHNLVSIGSREKMTRALLDIGVSPDARPGDLSIEKWQKLYEVLN